jgi:thiosulfate/3-mercaptopyruvate sulfurtransferase
LSTEIFCEVAWVAAHSDDPTIRIVDARSTPHGAPGQNLGPSGRERYAAGHIPGAVYLDYADDLSDPSTPYATRTAPAELFARVMERSGIGDQTFVVAYDDGNVPFAARMLWMLRYYGHDNATILAGGYPAWIAAGLATTTQLPHVAPARFTPRVRPAVRASRDEVLAVAQGRSDAQLLETQRNTTYALRDRDIARAQRLSGNDLLEDERGGRIAERAKLDNLVAKLKLDRSKRTILSCGSGVSAAGSYLALCQAGFTDAAVYDGSWLEWKHDGLPTVPKPPG